MTILIMAPAKAGPIFTTFDVPGASNTVAYEIDDGGTVRGTYTTSKGKCRSICGFTRAPDGTFSTFEILNCSQLEVTAVNTSGEIAGWCVAKRRAYGFIRFVSGEVVRVVMKHSRDNYVYALSDNGTVGGDFRDEYGEQPFLRLPDGSQHFPQSGKMQIGSVQGINAAGVSTGIIATFLVDSFKAFIYAPGQRIQKFSAPGCDTNTLAYAIDDVNNVAGICTVEPLLGFLRHADGSFETFDVGSGDKGNVYSMKIETVNNDLQIVGTATKNINDPHFYSFIRHGDGTLETFDISDGNTSDGGTHLGGLNTSGTIAGTYSDRHGRYHAYIRTP